MRFKQPHCKRLQGAADARRRARKRTFVLQVPDNKADAVPCERLRIFSDQSGRSRLEAPLLSETRGPELMFAKYRPLL